ncbi:DExH-box ATP-dependent RNA helicase DExH12-like protein [Tanacetum coccineum]
MAGYMINISFLILRVSHQDGLFMANKKYELPVRSYMKQKQGYKEVYLPALEPKPLAADEKLALIKNMPTDNILLSAPTGAGKTIVVMLTILQQIVHVLNDERGHVLESIVARTVRQVETRKEHIWFVGLSATLFNYDDVALFLRVDLKKGLFHFDNSYRHVPLAQQCISIMVEPSYQRIKLMNEICYEKVIGVAGKHQVLIFVSSRNKTTETAREIIDTARAKKTIGILYREDSREILHERSKLVISKDLKDLLPYGLAIHHAGIYPADRELVEKLFADGHIQVLVSTTTLSKGVNLLAHSMLSRVGKPQCGNYSEGIIITGHSELQYYLKLMNQQLPIESQFLSKLADHLNAEIVHDAATVLDIYNLVEYDRKSGNFEVTDIGRITSKYCINHETIATYNKHLNPIMSDIELCRLLLLSEEFKSTPVRHNEKKELAKLLDSVHISIKEGLEDPSTKINILLQAYIFKLKPKGFYLTSDMDLITQVGFVFYNFATFLLLAVLSTDLVR